MKIKQGDKVLVRAGKYKGKTGDVMRILKKQGKLTATKVNIRTRHIKKTPQRAGQIIKYEAPLPASNVMLICPNCNKAVRVGYKILKASKKLRVCKKCGESVDQAITKQEKKKK